MKPTIGFVAALCCLWMGAVAGAGAADLDTAKIEAATGLKGSFNQAEGVFKVASPRADVPVSVDGFPMAPFMGLTTWAAFQADPKAGAMVMGDIVLFQDEVNPAMSAALDNGLAVTALHNHFFYDEPKVYFMHIEGEGPAEKLASAFGQILETIKKVRAASPQPATGFGYGPIPSPSAITAQVVEGALSAKADTKDGMAKVTIGLNTKMSCGCSVGKTMGVNTWAAFAGTDDNALVDGDFAVKEEQLQPVLKSLRASGINVVAIHSHMTGETPRILFLHYWGRGKVADLAAAPHKALQTQGKP